MKIHKAGDATKAICERCQSLQKAIFMLRDVPLSDGSGTVKNVLVGVCNNCDQVCLLPQQSVPAVAKQLDIQRKAVESRLPAHLLDILNLATYELGGSSDFVPNLMKYYIHHLSSDHKAAKKISRYLKSDLVKGKAVKRLSLKGRRVSEELETLKSVSNIEGTTELIKVVILAINDDILVNKKKRPIEELKSIVAAVV